MANSISAKLNPIRSGLALAAIFGWLLSFPMFGSLLVQTSGEKVLVLGLTFMLSHALGLLVLHFITPASETAVRIASIAVALLTLVYAFVDGVFLVDFLILLAMGVASAYLVLAWVAEFITVTSPILNLAVAMASANIILAAINAPWHLPQQVKFVLVAVSAVVGSFLIQRGRENGKVNMPDLKQYSVKLIKALVAFVIAIYFVGGIWYQNMAMQMMASPDWDAAIGALIYAVAIIILAFISLRSQPGNLAIYSLSSLGVSLLIILTELGGMFTNLAYHMALNFGFAAADLFFWYALWVLARLYEGRRVFGTGLGFSLVLIALSVLLSSSGRLDGSPALLYIMALTLLFLAAPFIFHYPFQLADMPVKRPETAAGLEGHLDDALTPPEILTPTEQKIYTLLMQGKTNKEIAEEMVISQHTVKFHTRNTFRKLGVKNRKELLSRSLNKNKY
ncbi:helix-turn-helix transcriptional regulator [Dethiobacter alkaliphilus]|uniref:helix-turn-helix transcriptional regulator n=1 Tax=Dethiobacter alkaliphilus TaxID=427926 RepID=UPI0022260CDA|nr:helix-turn-helix transcriptional regulator [Dethiobacter alkaliphilus]MCW3490310.1 helix-turn-helix transcriptional regulator [Dethiobacter alkaliphilus]